MADEFNKFFVNIGKKLAKNLQSQVNHRVDFDLSKCNNKTLFLRYTTSEEIDATICNLKNTKR